jgi:prepilin-type N-terminal cleavage/methylation domain-containing protein
MEKICKMLKRNNKGFTLVELMVVLLIIGILVAIAIPIYNRTTDNAYKKTCYANQRTIEGAAAQWAADKDKTLKDAELNGTGWIDVLVGDDKYIAEKPMCKKGGNTADYTWDSTTGKVVCPLAGEDKHLHYGASEAE